MSFGKRALFTLLAMVIASFVVGLLWRGAFDARIPSYLSGVVGGLSAIAAWEFFRPK
jgi:hypothetical protein